MIFLPAVEPLLQLSNWLKSDVSRLVTSGVGCRNSSQIRGFRSARIASRLTDASKWASGGFVALVGVLTFFQIKDGILDRLLRVDATAALWIFLLIGIGVASSLFAGAFRDNVTTPMPVIITGLLLLAVLTTIFLRNIAHDPFSDTNLLLIACIVGFAVLFVATRDIVISTGAAVLILGVAATSMGLYGAAKLSVMSKSYVADSRVTATVESSDNTDVVKITAQADQRDKKNLFVSVVGYAGATPGITDRTEVLGSAKLVADAGGSIDTSVSIPVRSALWDYISVRSCDALPCAEESEVVLLTSGRPPATLPRVSGTISPAEDGTNVDVSLTATDLPIDWVMTGYVFRIATDGGETLLAQGAVSTNSTGAAEWKVVHVSPGQGQRLELRYDWCAPVKDAVCTHSAPAVVNGVLTLPSVPYP